MRLVDLLALAGVAAVLATVVASTLDHRTPVRRVWSWWGALVTATAGIACWTSSVLLDWPDRRWAGLAAGCLAAPVVVVMTSRPARWSRWAQPVLAQTIVAAGLLAMVAAVYVLVVVGLGRPPEGHERSVLGLSIGAAALVCIAAAPVRRRLEIWANQRVYGERHPPDEALRTFAGRMSRAVPMDELLLQLVEVLRATMSLSAAEIWTGTDGRLSRAVSVPERGAATLVLGAKELPVVARGRAQGNAWLQVWAPALMDGRDDTIVRSVPIAHLGALLGLLVVERRADGTPFNDEEDRVLVDLARQVGLALHNVRLDSALQASLVELQQRNAELAASRARIVAAADETRRHIERDLHDGAQQHLVALAVKLGLARTLFDADPSGTAALLDELRDDVQVALRELRELAHGIFPPLLRDRGLAEALRTAANRAGSPTTVNASELPRFDPSVEAAVYFCCLEALQNAGKHAGPAASITITLGYGAHRLWCEVTDDGVGFDARRGAEGHGFVNMRDRIGALGGELIVRSRPGSGTTVRAELSAEPSSPAGPDHRLRAVSQTSRSTEGPNSSLCT